jgi:hypothetical protein
MNQAHNHNDTEDDYFKKRIYSSYCNLENASCIPCHLKPLILFQFLEDVEISRVFL